jgi:hypothetical protein
LRIGGKQYIVKRQERRSLMEIEDVVRLMVW